MGGIRNDKESSSTLFLDFQQFKAMCSELTQLQMTHVKQIFDEIFTFMVTVSIFCLIILSPSTRETTK